jgi:hypothetical protein
MTTSTTAPSSQIHAWFTGRLPDWFAGTPEITFDADEILVVGELSAPEVEGDDQAKSAAAIGSIQRFREETRGPRMQIADEAEAHFGRKVAWGASIGDARVVFTSLAIPVMTRLRLRERAVLDTLVAAGVARSRADALGWCVRLVAKNESVWLSDLTSALTQVEAARAKGPGSART